MGFFMEIIKDIMDMLWAFTERIFAWADGTVVGQLFWAILGIAVLVFVLRVLVLAVRFITRK